MTGVCADCGRETRVPSTRGARLADQSCPHCGGTLQGKNAGKPRASGKLVHCAICGKARREGSRQLKRPAFAFEARWGNAFGADNPGPHPAGAPCCWSHELIPAGLVADLEPQLAALVEAADGHVFFLRELQREEREALATHLQSELLPEEGTVGRAMLQVAALAELAGARLDDVAADEHPDWPLVLSRHDRVLLADRAGFARLALAQADGSERIVCLYPLRGR